MFGYLSEFWNAITEVGGTTVAWFQSVGNAVAGAIGNLFYTALHYVNDTWVFLGWIFSIISQLVSLFLLPLTFVFNFLKGFVANVFAPPVSFSYSWSTEILGVFNHIPYWTEIGVVLGACLSVIVVIGLLWLFTKL